MDIPMTWETAAALWVLGLIHADDVADLGLQAIGTSRESDSIRKVVYGTHDQADQLRLFGDALSEQHVLLPSRVRAAHIVAGAVCRKLIEDSGDLGLIRIGGQVG